MPMPHEWPAARRPPLAYGLAEAQEMVSRFVLEDDPAGLAGILGRGFSPAERLAIYRNNTYAGLTEALRDTFPVTGRLVGEDCFTSLAHAYIRRHPPESGCLLGFGGGFGEFLAALPELAAWPYLPDTARLEWACHEAYYAADGAALGLDRLQGITPEDYAGLRFRLLPSARLLTSPYPVLHIWQTNQPEVVDPPLVNLGQGASRVLVYRPGWEVAMLDLSEGEYRFLAAVADGATLAGAFEQAAEGVPDFDVSDCLSRCLVSGAINDFVIDTP